MKILHFVEKMGKINFWIFIFIFVFILVFKYFKCFTLFWNFYFFFNFFNFLNILSFKINNWIMDKYYLKFIDAYYYLIIGFL
jgi:hypothetical protein